MTFFVSIILLSDIHQLALAFPVFVHSLLFFSLYMPLSYQRTLYGVSQTTASC